MGNNDCSACKNKPPELHSSNRQVWHLYESCTSQLRGGGFGVFALDQTTIMMKAEKFGIKWTLKLDRKIQILESLYIGKINGSRDKSRNKRRIEDA